MINRYYITHLSRARIVGGAIRLEDMRNEGAIDGYATQAEAQSALDAMRAQAIACGNDDYAAELGIEAK